MNRKSASLSLVIIVGILLIGHPSAALDSEGVLNQMKQKYGDIMDRFEDITISQEIELVSPAQGRAISSEMTMFQKGEKMRIDTKIDMPEGANMPSGMEQMESTIIYDGNNAWMIMPFMGKVKVPQAEAFKNQTGINWWEKVFGNADVVGEEEIDGKACYILKTRDKTKPPFLSRLWVDKKDLVMVRAEMTGAKGATSQMRFSDFRRLEDDLKFPYYTETYMGNKLLSKVTVKSIEVNTGLSDNLFDPDTAAKNAPSMKDMMKQMM